MGPARRSVPGPGRPALAPGSLPVLLALLAFLVRDGAALRCWSCGSDTRPECRDPFRPGELQGPIACSEPPPPAVPGGAPRAFLRPVCSKAVVQVNEAETHVYRSCDWVRRAGGAGGAAAGESNLCLHIAGILPPHSALLACERCESDGCNGARPSAGPALQLLLLPPALALAGALAAPLRRP